MSKGHITDLKVKLTDGRMHYLATGQGPALVLLHSLGRTAYSWSEVLPALGEKHAVYAIDMMGHGDSDKPSRDYTMEDYGRSVVEFMEAMKLASATLIGNSIGSTIAVIAVANNPQRVDKLVLVGCPFRQTAQERREAIETARTQYDEAGSPLPRSLEDLKQTYVHVNEELRSKVNTERAKAGVWAWKALLALNSYDAAPALAKIACPTLLIFGEKDMLRAKEEVLKALIKGSKLVITPDAGHLPQVDNPTAFLKAVLPFLG